MSCLLLVVLLEVYIWLKMVCVFFSHMIKFGGRYVAFSFQEWKNYKVEMNKCNWFGRDFNWFFLNLIFFPLKLWVLRTRFLFPTWWHQNFDKSFQKEHKSSLSYILHYKSTFIQKCPNLFIEKWQNLLKTNPLLGMLYQVSFIFPFKDV